MHPLRTQKGFKKKHKIMDRCEHVTYEVVEKLDNIPVYKIRPCMNWSTTSKNPYCTPQYAVSGLLASK